MGAGKAIVSTPYAYARELLADGRGVLVAPGSPDALAGALIELARDPSSRAAIGRRAYDHSRGMVWSAGRREYRRDLRPCRAVPAIDAVRGRRPGSSRPSVADRAALPGQPRAPRRAMTGRLGIWQHAVGDSPRPGLRLLHRRCRPGPPRRPAPRPAARLGGGPRVRLALAPVPRRGLRPGHGTVPQLPRARTGPGSMRPGSEDSQGRAMLALGDAIADAPETACVAEAARSSRRAAGRPRLDLPRAIASSALGCAAALTRPRQARLAPRTIARSPWRARRAAPRLRVGRPRSRLAVARADAHLRERPAAAGAHRRRAPARRPADAPHRAARARLAHRVQTTPDGTFSPIGNRLVAARRRAEPVRPAADRGDVDDPGRRGRVRATRRGRATCEPSSAPMAGSSATTTSALPVADPADGGCHDGLTPPA